MISYPKIGINHQKKLVFVKHLFINGKNFLYLYFKLKFDEEEIY